MDKAFKQIPSLMAGDVVVALLRRRASDPSDSWPLIDIYQEVFNYENAVRLRDWLIAATGGEGREPSQDALDAGLAQLPKGVTSLQLLGCWNAISRSMNENESRSPAAPQVGEGEPRAMKAEGE